MSALLYVISVLIWGTTFFAITLQVGDVPATQSVFYRYAIAAVVLWTIALLRGGLPHFDRGIHLRFATLGLMMFSFNYVLVYLAAERMPSGLISVLFSMMILVNTLQVWLLFGEKTEFKFMIGALLGTCGVVLLFLGDLLSANVDRVFLAGFGLAVLSTLSASTGNIVSHRLSLKGVNVMSANTWGMSYGSLFLFIAVSVSPEPWQFKVTMEYIGSLLYLSIFGSVIAFFAYLTLLGRIGAPRAAYIAIFYSMLALLISTFLEGLQWSTPMLIGVVMILIGNVFILPSKNTKLSKK